MAPDSVADVLCALGVIPACLGLFSQLYYGGEAASLCSFFQLWITPQGSQPPSPNVELPPNPGVFPGNLIKPLFTLGLTAQGSSCPSDRPNNHANRATAQLSHTFQLDQGRVGPSPSRPACWAAAPKSIYDLEIALSPSSPHLHSFSEYMCAHVGCSLQWLQALRGI